MSAHSSTIKAVLFDFDGVLTTDRTGSESTIRALSEITGASKELIASAYCTHIGDLVLGHKSHADVLPEISACLNAGLGPDQIKDAFERTPLNQPMLDLANSLATHYRLGIITDNPSDRMSHIVAANRLDELFDPIVVSADVGYSKHSEEIFVRALTILQLTPSEVIFIDNTEKNLLIARQIGLNAIHHNDANNDVGHLKMLLANNFGLEGLETPAAT